MWVGGFHIDRCAPPRHNLASHPLAWHPLPRSHARGTPAATLLDATSLAPTHNTLQGSMWVSLNLPRVEARDLRPEVPPEQTLVISSGHKASFLMLDVRGWCACRLWTFWGILLLSSWRACRLWAWPGGDALVVWIRLMSSDVRTETPRRQRLRCILTHACMWMSCVHVQWAASAGMAHQALAMTLQKPLLVAELRCDLCAVHSCEMIAHGPIGCWVMNTAAAAAGVAARVGLVWTLACGRWAAGSLRGCSRSRA